MTTEDILLGIGGELDTARKRILLRNITPSFLAPKVELREAFFDMNTKQVKKLAFDYSKNLNEFISIVQKLKKGK